jgi:phosphonate transport system substrate-binding protein
MLTKEITLMQTKLTYLKRITGLLTTLLLFYAAASYCQPKTDELPFFNIAFSEKIFVNVNSNDATALTKVLTENLLEKSPFTFRTGSPNIYSSMEEMEESVKHERNDLYILLPEEFLRLNKFGMIDPIAVSLRNNSVYDVYKIIVSKESNIKNLKDLKDKSILVGYSSGNDNPHLWLDYLLSTKGISKREKYFKSIEISQKSLPVILQVYFGQADACIISDDKLNLAIEMNPQLGENLVVIEISKPLLRAILAEKKSKPEKNKKLLLDNLLNLDKTTEGKQVLTLFRIDKLIPYKEEYLQSFYELTKN